MVIYRTAGTNDQPAVAQIYRKALADIYKRHGFPDEKLLPRGVNPFYDYILKEEPEGFFVAEDSGKIIGATFSWIRETLWFLSHLFILPEYQGKGIGKTLLKKSLEYSENRRIVTRCVITMAFNTVSLSLYMRNGMFPLQNIILFGLSGPPNALKNGYDSLSWEYAEPAASGIMDDLHTIDKAVLGLSRTGHHRYFMEDQQTPCLLFRNRQDTIIGYAYLWPDGRIGPVAAMKDATIDTILGIAVEQSRNKSPNITMMIPGSNRVATETALSMGFTVRLPYTLLSNQPFGAWDRYLFHSPGLM
jgi:GNAT superfamily N-acetyltransferase